MVALAIALPAAAMASPSTPGRSGSRCGPGLLLVVAVDGIGVEKGLADLVAIRTEQGLRAGLDPDSRVDAAVSLVGMERVDKLVAPALAQHRLNAFGDGYKKQYQQALDAAKAKIPPAGYVQITLRRDLAATSVELELVCLSPEDAGNPDSAEQGPIVRAKRATPPASAAAPEGSAKAPAAYDGPTRPAGQSEVTSYGSAPRLAARKVVRVAGGSEEALLQAVFSAARRLAKGGGESPVVRILGGARRHVAVDEDVVIDASSSGDPDDDAIELEWRLLPREAPPLECQGWRQEGGRVHFRAAVPASCTFEVTAREVVDPTKATTTNVQIEVLGKPRVRVPENRVVYAAGPLQLKLEGDCESCARWRWIQVAGPLATEPVECNGPDPSSESRGCPVRAPVAGEYTFAMSGWNALGEDRKEYTVTVAPPPVALAYVPEKAIVHHRYVLDGSGSHDPEGGELRYHWQVSNTEFPAECGVPPRDDVPSVRLSAPTSARTEFTSSSVARELHVRLTVLTTRRIGGRNSTIVRCAPRDLPVERPMLWVALATGSDFDAKDQSWQGTRGSVVISVRLSKEWVPWLGLRAEQNLVRNDGRGTGVTALGGTLVGVTTFWTDWIHPYAGAYARTWGGHDARGLQAGVDLRLLRFTFASAGYRWEYRPDDKRWDQTITGVLGLGYDVL